MPIETFDPANSVLFLGSGFSAGARNIANQELPTGKGLQGLLATELGVSAEEYDLKSLADEYCDRFDLSLFDLIYRTFTVAVPSVEQVGTLSLPWARIYTTNYDDLIYHVKRHNFPTFTFEDKRPNRLPQSFGVYLHGSIRSANEDNSSSQIILDNFSYNRIAYSYPAWFNEFRRDRQTFDACYFIGFSLSDHHIAGLMTAGELSRSKTYFITLPNPNPTFVRQASGFGEIVPVGLKAFARQVTALPKPEGPTDFGSLPSLKYLRIGLDNKPTVAPTPVEISSLVTGGSFNQSRFFNLPIGSLYVAGREAHVRSIPRLLTDSRTVVAHARLGNGKNIFASVLAKQASVEGYRCLLWRRANRRLAQELEVVAKQPRVLIIFDDYDQAIENISRVAAGAPDARFVVMIRTGQQEVRLHEIVDRLPAPVKRHNINWIDNFDRAELLQILDRAGARPDKFEETLSSAKEMRDIVTKLYDHKVIRANLEQAVRQSAAPVNKLLVLTSLISWVGVVVEDDYLQEVLKRDIYVDLRSASHIASDLLDYADDHVRMRSSLLAEYLIQRVFGLDGVLSGCFDLITCSLRQASSAPIDSARARIHRHLSGQLMSFSACQRLLKYYPEFEISIQDHYNRLSQDMFVNAEPLFWLQNAIFMKSKGETDRARNFLNTGYDRASKRPRFKPYQLDTQSLSIYMLHEILRKGDVIECAEQIQQALTAVVNMLTDNAHRQYALEVLGEVEPFIDACHRALTGTEKMAFIFEIGRAVRLLEGFSIDDQVSTGSENVKRRIMNGMAILAQP